MFFVGFICGFLFAVAAIMGVLIQIAKLLAGDFPVRYDPARTPDPD